MRRIGKLGFAGLLAIGFAAQAQAGLFDIFKKKNECGSSACAPVCATTPAPCYTPPKIYESACAPAGCAPTACAPKPKSRGLFSCFKKSSPPACGTTNCAPVNCAPVNCAPGGCTSEPGCAIPTPCKATGGGLFSMFKKQPTCATTTSCAPPVCRSQPVYPITCGPAGCTTAGCADTGCKSSKGGLFSMFKKKSAPVGCAPAACAPVNCAPVTVTPQTCAPVACGAPATVPCKSGGGLFGLFKKKSSCSTTCAPVTCTNPSTCATSPVCVSKPTCAPQHGPVYQPGCSTAGCAPANCGSAGCLSMSSSRLAKTIYTAQAAPTPFQRKYAVEQLGKVDANSNPQVMSALVYALNDSDQGVRQVAAEEIDRVVARNQRFSNDGQVVTALNTALADPNQNVRQTAGRALQRCGYETAGCKQTSCGTVSCATTSCGAAGCAPRVMRQSAPVHASPEQQFFTEPKPEVTRQSPTPAVTPNVAPKPTQIPAAPVKPAQPTPAPKPVTPAAKPLPPAPPEAPAAKTPAVEADVFFPSRIEQPQASQPRPSQERIAADLFGLPN